MTRRSGLQGAPRGAAASRIPRLQPADLEGLQPGNVTAVLDDRAPVVVVDLDEPALSPGHLPVAFPGVVVGVSRTGWPAASRSASAAQSPDPGLVVGVDIVLVAGSGARGGPSRGAPWVVVEDADAELVRIGEAAARSPIALSAADLFRPVSRPARPFPRPFLILLPEIEAPRLDFGGRHKA